METWNTFTAGDLALAFAGVVGLITVLVTMSVAQRNVIRRERALRAARIIKAAEAQLEEITEAE